MEEINLIIDSTAFTEDKLVPQITDPAKFQRAIREAQQFDLRPLLGDALYYELVNNYNPDDSGGPDDKYLKLVDGEQYQDSQDQTIIFSGLRMVIKYYAYARLISGQQINVTSHSVTRKLSDYSEPVDGKTIAMEVSSARNGAASYWDEAKKYLNAKAADFPLWKCTHKAPRTGVKITAIG